MEPISIALGLASLTGLDKKIGRWLGGSNGEQVAAQVVEIAQAVTGAKQPEQVKQVLETDPQALLAFEEKLHEREHELERLAYRDRADARQMYRETEHEQADSIAQSIIRNNLWFVLLLAIGNAAAVIFLKEHAAVLATVSNLIGIVIKSLLDERKEVTGFYFGGSMDGRNMVADRIGGSPGVLGPSRQVGP
ncbi:hypothetical protein [Marinobacterium jannaschii]|uniref:hypothetical protein n=1 Tax=Marinobacterium jannaschii TaxID=64970 RepID=UPI00068588EA|nr:hypothetical protein [Marinobacterium jannaschii]